MADELAKHDPNPQDLLSPRERAAYRISVDRREPFLSARLADEVYGLFQSGKTCEEIADLNPKLSLGMIVRARVDFKWDEKRDNYLRGMFDRARSQAQQLSLESMAFLGDLLNAFHKHDRQKLQKFIQTGDPTELQGAMMLTSSSLKVYQSVLELLLRLTGQGETTTKKVQGFVEHVHTVAQPLVPAQEPAKQVELPVLPAGQPIEPATAAQVLDLIHKKRQQDE